MTTGDYLASISSLDTATAIEHLMAIREVYNAIRTGDLLAELSPLNIATALQHLLAIGEALVTHILGGGGVLPEVEYFDGIYDGTEVNIPTISLQELSQITDLDMDDIFNNDIETDIDEITSSEFGI